MLFLRVYEKQSADFTGLLGLVMPIFRTSKPWVPRSNRGSRTNEIKGLSILLRPFLYCAPIWVLTRRCKSNTRGRIVPR